MGKFEQRPNSGVLFKNDKGGVDTRPDYRGEANIGGVTLEISAWIKDGAKGKFMSLSFKDNGKHETREPAGEARRGRDADEPIPF